MSGHGIDDIALTKLGAKLVTGIDFSPAAVSSASRRAAALNAPCVYLEATMPRSGLSDACADLIYTGKGTIIWAIDLAAFLTECRRILRPGGYFFIYEAHPLVPLWDLDQNEIKVRADRGYFEKRHVNDSFPANGAVDQQHILGDIVMAVLAAGFRLNHLGEHPEPFWRSDGVTAACWDGRVPNTFSLLARC